MSGRPPRKKRRVNGGGNGKQIDTGKELAPFKVPARDVEEYNKDPKPGGMEFKFNLSTEHMKPNANVFGNLNQPPGWDSLPISDDEDEDEIPNVSGIEPEIMEQYRTAMKKQNKHIKKMLVKVPDWKGPNGGHYGHHAVRHVQPEGGNQIATFVTYQAFQTNKNKTGQVGDRQGPTTAKIQLNQSSNRGPHTTAAPPSAPESTQVTSTNNGDSGSYSKPTTTEHLPAQSSHYGNPASNPSQPEDTQSGQFKSYLALAPSATAQSQPFQYERSYSGPFHISTPHSTPWSTGNPHKYHGSFPDRGESTAPANTGTQAASSNYSTHPGLYQNPYTDGSNGVSKSAFARNQLTPDDPYGQWASTRPVAAQSSGPSPSQFGHYPTSAPAQHKGGYPNQLDSHSTLATDAAKTSNATGQKMKTGPGGLQFNLSEPPVPRPFMKNGKFINACDLSIRIGLEPNPFKDMPPNFPETPGYLAFRKTREDGTFVRKDWLPAVDNVMLRNHAGEFLDEKGVPYPYDDQRDGSTLLQIVPKNR